MPIYEFHCEQCERKTARSSVRSADWKNSKCPHCGSSKLHKNFSTFASANAGTAAPFGKKGGMGGGRSCGSGCGCH